jgi:hypothetical protein
MCQIVIPGSEVTSPARPLEPTEIDRYFLPAATSTPGFQPGAPNDVSGNGDFSPNLGGAVTPVQPPANPAPAGTEYASIQNTLEAALQQDWRERGRPPNPLIAEAWAVSGAGTLSVDGPKANPWCAAFATWALWKSGLEHNVPGISSQSYLRYGRAVEWQDYTKIRKYDLVVFTQRLDSARGHAAFVHSIDPARNRIKVFGGNQSNNVKLSEFPIFRPAGQSGLYVNQIRRNWDLPEGFDLPLVTVAGQPAPPPPPAPTVFPTNVSVDGQGNQGGPSTPLSFPSGVQ